MTVVEPGRTSREAPSSVIALIGRLTLLTALVNARHITLAVLIAAAFTVFLFLDERRLRSPAPWLALAAALGAVVASRWWRLENHEIATVLWVAAFGFSMLGVQPRVSLRLSARSFLVVLFGLAFAWKLFSSQYMSNDFFRYTLVWDARFAPVSELVAGVDGARLESAQSDLRSTTVSERPTGPVVLPEGPRSSGLAWSFTAVGLVLEGAIALLYAVPLASRLRWLRPASVLAFCGLTYLAVPVVPFGLLLLTLAAAETPSPAIRRICVVGAGVLMAWGFVFATFVV